ncbi:DUF362 domain-containing protein [Methanoregula sp.]|uniref:DUF362 domain-containing protein n=1 Tax=Methanoregula sp. TaxID=2052170 RepID=UPI0035632EB5
MGEQVDIFIADAADRFGGVESVLGGFDLSVLAGSSVAVKADYDSANPFPASTHLETLDAIFTALSDEKPESITLAERSSVGETREVLADLGVIALARDRGFPITLLDEMERFGWHEIQAPGLHWSRGFFLAAPISRSDHVIQICGLKTDRYGSHFALSLKNAVGCIARRVPNVNYDFMNELDNSPVKRSMIAEINQFFRTDLIVLDATEGFASGGPDKGKVIHPGVVLAGPDRVAIDAVGVALLRACGTVPDVADGRIFDQEQIARAAELGVGISSAKAIRLVPLDRKAEEIAAKIQVQLDAD